MGRQPWPPAAPQPALGRQRGERRPPALAYRTLKPDSAMGRHPRTLQTFAPPLSLGPLVDHSCATDLGDKLALAEWQ